MSFHNHVQQQLAGQSVVFWQEQLVRQLALDIGAKYNNFLFVNEIYLFTYHCQLIWNPVRSKKKSLYQFIVWSEIKTRPN